jgi:hypothetical protein
VIRKYPRQVIWIRSGSEKDPVTTFGTLMPGLAVKDSEVPGGLRFTDNEDDQTIYAIEVSNPGHDTAVRLLMHSMRSVWFMAIEATGKDCKGRSLVQNVTLSKRMLEPLE